MSASSDEKGAALVALPVARPSVLAPCGTARACLTPLYFKDPPPFDTDAGPIPPALDAAYLRLPPAAQQGLACCALVPFYTEDGHMLRRTVEALTLQRDDLQRAEAALRPGSGRQPELHALGVADGWRREDGASILSDSMFADIAELFGPTLDVGALLDLLEGPSPPDGGTAGAAEPLPDSVLVQFAVEGASGTLVLAPIAVDCSWAASMKARAAAPMGAVAAAVLAGAREPQPPPGGGALVRPLFFSLLIKRRNARKHQSQHSFFAGFWPVQRLRSPACNYALSTDCGTLYEPFMLAQLLANMDAEPAAGACSAYQQPMRRSDQEDPLDTAPETWAHARLRDWQAFDLDMMVLVFFSAHDLLGFLPLVHGPCGVFRADAMNRFLLGRVHTLCNTPPAQQSLVVGNLKISEDRMLTFLLALPMVDDEREALHQAQQRRHVAALEAGIVPRGTPPPLPPPLAWTMRWAGLHAGFFFEAEDSLKELVFQRRRWVNGNVTGFAYLLTSPHLYRGLARMHATSWGMLLLAILQIIAIFGLFIYPAAQLIAGMVGIGVICVLAGEVGGSPFPEAAVSAIAVLWAALYVCSFAAFLVAARYAPTAFTPWAWKVRAVFSTLSGTLVLVNIVVYPIVLILSTVAHKSYYFFPESASPKTAAGWTLATGLLLILFVSTPLFLARLQSRRTLRSMVRRLVSAYLSAGLLLGDVFAYSMARLDDLSWGTKAIVAGAPAAGGSGADLRRRLPRPAPAAAAADASLGLRPAVARALLRREGTGRVMAATALGGDVGGSASLGGSSSEASGVADGGVGTAAAAEGEVAVDVPAEEQPPLAAARLHAAPHTGSRAAAMARVQAAQKAQARWLPSGVLVTCLPVVQVALCIAAATVARDIARGGLYVAFAILASTASFMALAVAFYARHLWSHHATAPGRAMGAAVLAGWAGCVACLVLMVCALQLPNSRGLSEPLYWGAGIAFAAVHAALLLLPLCDVAGPA